MRVYELGWAQTNFACPYEKREFWTQRHRETQAGECHVKAGGGSSDRSASATSQGTRRMCRSCWRLEGRHGTESPSERSRCQPCRHLDFKLLASSRESVSAVLSHPVCGALSGRRGDVRARAGPCLSGWARALALGMASE